ncbi:MAG: radical protein [Caulobacteraceae bacterium]|nr:radical protein [Caulobacteraceae bacterium]
MVSPPPKLSGRGARSNATSRFVSAKAETFDDGWEETDAEPARLSTVVQPMKSKTIIARNDSPDISFSRSINPYRGCEHGCIYCYARPAHAYMGLSPGLDFESRLFFKPEAGRLLVAELSKPGYKPAVIHIGGDTDPYQPIERRLRVTREVIETLARFRHPFTLISKSNLILRDLDLLGPLGRDGLVQAFISVTTLDRRLARSMEPRAATPARRLEAVERLNEAGVPTGVMFAPVIPGLNDHELDAVLMAAAKAGALRAGYVLVRLPLEISALFQEWLETDQPGRAAKVMSLIRQTRGGKDYVSEFGERQKGKGPVADLLARRMAAARKRYGLDRPFPELDLGQFRLPPKAGDQLKLF